MTILRPPVLLLALTLPGWAALAPDAIEAQQAKAPEVLQLNITNVVKKAVKQRGAHSFAFTVHAKVIKVLRTETDLVVGSEIVITYSRPDQKRTPTVGDWPPEVKMGERYQAFLRRTEAKMPTYRPVAHSGSFLDFEPKPKPKP